MTIIDIIAVIGSMTGAWLVAHGNHTRALIGYACFTVGNLATLWLLFHSTASLSLVFINFYFLIINFYGMYQRRQLQKVLK